MTPDRHEFSLDRLVPAVLDYETEQFRLKDDLDCLNRVWSVAASEASAIPANYLRMSR